MTEGWLEVRRRLQSIARKRGTHIERGMELTEEAAAAIAAAREADLPMREIADLLGISRERAYKILEAGSTPTPPAGSGR